MAICGETIGDSFFFACSGFAVFRMTHVTALVSQDMHATSGIRAFLAIQNT